MKKVVIEVNGKVFVNGEEYVKKQKDDIILVPKNIKIAEKGSKEVSKGILFNNRKQELFINLDSGVYEVLTNYRNPFLYQYGELKLTKCNREDLKIGDLAFRTGAVSPLFDETYSYCLILDKEKYCYITLGYCEYACVANTLFPYWYKVEEV